MIDVDDTSPETRTDEVEGDSDEVVPFVLGGRVRITGRGVVALAAVLAFALIPVRGLLRAPGSSMEEGFMLVFPRLVQQGEVPNVDFLHLYGPGSLEVLAGWY
ncbi:MAG: hypothetical protein ABJ382_02620, partial [Ilumatobacter sp.]